MSPTKQEAQFEAAASPVDTLLTALKHAAHTIGELTCTCKRDDEKEPHQKTCGSKKATQRYYRRIAQVQKEQA